MRKVGTTMALIWVLIISIITAGCPKNTKSALESGFAASVRISSYGTDLTKGFTQLRRDGAISKELFDSTISKLEKVAIAGRKVHDLLEGFVERYPDGSVPASEFQPVNLLFNSDVYGPVIELLATYAGLSPAHQALLSVAMSGMKAAVNVVRRLMDKFSIHLVGPKGVEYVTA